MERITVEQLTEAERKHYDERLGHLLDDGYSEPIAKSICLDAIVVRRDLKNRMVQA